MANASKDVRKCHDRLETFLRRALDFDTYERIRAHESCIVCSEKENRAFKFVILCDSWIYLMDNDPGKLSVKNPRKTAEDLQKILSKVIHLQDIVSVSQVCLFICVISVPVNINNIIMLVMLVHTCKQWQ